VNGAPVTFRIGQPALSFPDGQGGLKLTRFVVGLSAAVVTDDARWNLRGRNLAIHAGGRTERVRFDDAAQVCEALTDRFGIDLTGLGDVEARVAQVLDS
jgi:arylamine N-acetyltransferase